MRAREQMTLLRMICRKRVIKKGSGVFMKPSGIGGMAVIEGVMMKNKDEYAVAVRKPNNEIAVEKKTHKDFADKVKLFKFPIFRGMLAFVDSMVIGVKVLNYAASFFEDEEEQKKPEKKNKASKADRKDSKAADQRKQALKAGDMTASEDKEDKSNALLMAAAVVVSLVISITFFMVLPVLISNVFEKMIDSPFWLSMLEGLLRIVIFIGYILIVSQMPDIKRVFMYHGAEHKTINCLENGFELTLENVKWQSKEHKRCGTSFMLLVMLISVIFFIILQPGTLWLRVVSRILLVPIIAGISYEFIRFAGKTDNIIINILSKPGLWMQALTTKEPEDSMIEVAIQSVDAVYDWRGFLQTYEAQEKSVQKTNDPAVIRQPAAQGIKAKNTAKSHPERGKAAPVSAMSLQVPKKNEEEDDEILKALDKYLDCNDHDAKKIVN